MLSPFRSLIMAVVLIPLAFSAFAVGYVEDDELPEVRDRVARISLAVGDVMVRRSGSDWEKAIANLPLVEGDEVATDAGGRVEIQFNASTYVRLGERSYFKITTLNYDGIAVSLSEGTAGMRINDFDKDRAFFEIDIPRSTIAVEKSGYFRIDVGDRNSIQARIRITDGGQARIYSETSGFTLRNGRAATVFLDGAYAGEWQTGDAGLDSDEFDTWSNDRDDVIARRLRDAYYDRYYDRDIYGADELNDHGEWIYTRSYGYVWRPYRSSIGRWSDWSPYRYGHWRWIPPFGWTWINDEPWGWATYHHGRWIWDSGHWVWTPYGYYRYRRSWWSPALVYITVYERNVCWYPLPYNARYYDYNRQYRRRRDHVPVNPSPTPRPNVPPVTAEQRPNMRIPTFQRIPPGGVVSMPAETFGREVRGTRRPPLSVAQAVVSKMPDENQSPPILPPIEETKRTMSKDIVVETPPIFVEQQRKPTGAAERRSERPLDEELKRTRNFGDRKPLETVPQVPVETRPSQPERRDTGAVGRPVRNKVETPSGPPIIEQPTSPVEKEEPRRPAQPRYQPPPRTEEPKSDPPRRVEIPPVYVPPRTETPRYDPPKREDPPRRYDPPPKYDPPKSDPPKRSDPPPKSEPAPDKKPEKPVL